MIISKITSEGRLTIPIELRKKFNLFPGRKVKFETTEDSVRIIPVATTEEIKENAGFLEMKGKLLESFMEEKKREKAL